ncbi:MAG TPA: radical SAM protein, partial [Myxococcales bacterium]
MQLSRFVVAYKDVRPGEHVLYSVLDDRYVGVDDPTLKALDRWRQGSTPSDTVERETQDALLEDGFLVRSRDEDDLRLRAHLDRASDGVPGTLFVTLMPTLQCNLACNYCFQKDFPAFTKMSSPTEDATLEWILRLVDERGLSDLQVHYFGGEPTTRKDFCLRSAKILGSAMRARGGRFAWQMTTNGVLLDLPFAKEMESYGQGQYKITLDGDKESHDQERVYRDGRGSFDQIF